MEILRLAESKYQVVAVMDGTSCPALDFLLHGEAATESARHSLIEILQHVSEKGLHGIPPAWVHEANKKHGIYEFIKGRLRLFFFKGENGQIAVCTSGVIKKGQKADKGAVQKAAEYKSQYYIDMKNNNLQVVEYGTE